jgi:hypothetical protein
MKRETKQHQYRHQQIDKTTPMKTSTDEQNSINKNINRSTKQHQQIDKTTPSNRQINTNKNINRQTKQHQ